LQGWWPVSGNGWILFFATQTVLYLMVYWALGLVNKAS